MSEIIHHYLRSFLLKSSQADEIISQFHDYLRTHIDILIHVTFRLIICLVRTILGIMQKLAWNQMPLCPPRTTTTACPCHILLRSKFRMHRNCVGFQCITKIYQNKWQEPEQRKPYSLYGLLTLKGKKINHEIWNKIYQRTSHRGTIHQLKLCECLCLNVCAGPRPSGFPPPDLKLHVL